MNKYNLLEALREAESMIGTETTEMVMDSFPEHRRAWLAKVRNLLAENGVEPENLSCTWRSFQGNRGEYLP